jgi:uncharacterized protein YhaN
VKLRELQIDRFGRWTGLRLRGLSDGLNVFLGSNESGKTTLLHFLRAVLYGFSPERRKRFVLSRGGATAGGSVALSANGAPFTVSRHDAGDLLGRLRVVDAAGKDIDAQRLNELLKLEESIFNKVFAVGLWEIQELSTLSDAEVASRLYDLAAGLDRASVASAFREVRETRRQLLSEDGQSSYLSRLCEERRRLAAELEEGKSINRRFAQLHAGLKDLEDEIRRAEQSRDDLQTRLNVTDAAIAVSEPWQRRSPLLAKMASLGNPVVISDDAVRRLELCKDRIRRCRAKVRRLRERRAKLRSMLTQLTVNETWLQHAPSLIALADQREWIATLQQRGADLQEEVDELKRQIAAEEKRLGVASQKPAAVHHASPQLLRELRPLDKALRKAAHRHEHVEQKAVELEQTAASLAQQIEAALADHGEDDLAAALERANGWVHTLRRRAKLDDEIERIEQSLAETDDSSLAPLDEPLAGKKSLVGLSIFVVSVPMIFAGMLFGGGLGWMMGFLGLGGLATGGWLEMRGKRVVQNAVDEQQRIDDEREQLEAMLDERERLDEEIPGDDTPLSDRLQAAQEQAATLEELLPLGEQQQAAVEEAEAARTRVDQAGEELRAAQEAWNAALKKAGIAPGVELHQLREWKDNSEHLAELQQRLQRRERELVETKRTHQDFVVRIERLFHELGLVPAGNALAQLQELRQELLKHEETWRRRERLLAQSRHLWRRANLLSRQGKRWSRRRRAILRHSGAADETQLYRLIEQSTHVRELRAQIDKLDREIAERLGPDVSPDSVAELLDRRARSADQTPLPQARRDLHAQLQRVQHDLIVCQERRGDLETEMKRLAKDRSLAEKALDQGVVEEQWSVAARQWQIFAATSFVLDSVRETYETKRQPEVLQDASRYLSALTEKKYVRVWAPLGEESLRVDAAHGGTFDVPLLSRGTREQLFLALRLALVRSYARRGVELPLALDDVLVNFDARRTRAAAQVLRDYAHEGQQLLIFTCHEHVAETFRALSVPVFALPEQGEEMVLDMRVDAPHNPAAISRPLRDNACAT